MKRLFVLAMLLALTAVSVGCRQRSWGMRRCGKTAPAAARTGSPFWRYPARLRAPACNQCAPGAVLPSAPVYTAPPVIQGGSPIITQPINGAVLDGGTVIDGTGSTILQDPGIVESQRVILPGGFDGLQVDPPATVIGPESATVGG